MKDQYKMKGIVTGAAGFISQQVLRTFKEAGYQVGAVDLFDPKIEGVPFKKANIVSSIETNKAFSHFNGKFGGLDFVIHLAACFNYSKPDSMMKDVNVQGTYNVADAAREIGRVKYFMNMGAVAEYKEGAGLEDKIKEDTPLEPIEPYGKTKHEAGEVLFQYHKNGDFSVLHPRACTVYGYYQVGTYLHGQFNMIKDNRLIFMPMKKTKNSDIHTKNIANLYVYALENPDKVFNENAKELNDIAINLGEDEVVTDVEKTKYLAKIIPGKSRIVLPVVPDWALKSAAHLTEFVESFIKNRCSLPVGVVKHLLAGSHNLDTSRLKATGFKCANTVEEGYQDVVDWYVRDVWRLPKPEFEAYIID